MIVIQDKTDYKRNNCIKLANFIKLHDFTYIKCLRFF